MKKLAKLFLGFSIAAIGVLWILNVTGVIGFDIFFRGWWTLLIILPCTAHLIAHPNWGSFSGIALGAILLLQAQGYIDWSVFWKLCLAIISRDGRNILKISSAFGEQNHRVEAEEFDGADIEASFGSVRLDLRNAIFNEDVEVRVKASFAGVGIYVPKDVNVDVRSNSAFGGVNNKTADRLRQQSGSHTILIIAECSFAGVEVM